MLRLINILLTILILFILSKQVMACERVGFVNDIKKHPNIITLPDGEGPFPLVIISHGGNRGGFLKGYQDWVLLYSKNGIATIFIDSIKSRGCPGERWEFGDRWRYEDLNHALDQIQHMPEFDQKNIFIQGHSAGTAMSLRASTGSVKKDLAGAISFYPAVFACSAVGKNEDKIPHLVIIGNKDEPALRCWNSTGKKFTKIQDAAHAFDTAMKSHCRTDNYKDFGRMTMCLSYNKKARAEAESLALEFIKTHTR
jgi:dienelactone hydrolase